MSSLKASLSARAGSRIDSARPCVPNYAVPSLCATSFASNCPVLADACLAFVSSFSSSLSSACEYS